MISFNFLSISFLVIFSSYQFQVNALLNVTMEAFDVGHNFITEVVNKFSYADKNELSDQIRKLTTIFCDFMNKIDLVRTKTRRVYSSYYPYSESLIDSFPNLYQFFEDSSISTQNPCENIHLKLVLKYPNDTLFYASDYLYVDGMRSIHENDYNLNGEHVWKDILNEAHKLLVTIDAETGQTPLNFLTSKTEVSKCIQRISRQQLIFYMLQQTALWDVMAYTNMQFTYAYMKMFFDAYHLIGENVKRHLEVETALWKEKNLIKKMKVIEREFLDRNSNTLQAFRASMNVTRNLWNCQVEHEKKKLSEDDWKKKLQVEAFQNYVINEVDLNSDGTCKQDCPYYKRSKVYGCFDNKICAQQRPCDGTLWNCEQKSDSGMEICFSKKQGSKSRYEYVDIKGQRYGGDEYSTCNNGVITAETWQRGFYKCSYCMCTCENSNSTYDRYVNLRPVVSDTKSNYVVTGVRFKKQEQIIYIQIEQGKLLENGIIDTSASVDWSTMDYYTISDKNIIAGKDYYAVSWNEKTICLDELDSPNKSHILTGLRFKNEFDGHNYLKLEIRLTPFDFKTGRLLDENSYWYSNNARLSDRKEVNLDSYNATNLESDQYFHFTVSPFELDAGQTTVPYIDTQKVNSYTPVPLSGAGLFLAKGHSLAMKALTYDIQPFL